MRRCVLLGGAAFVAVVLVVSAVRHLDGAALAQLLIAAGLLALVSVLAVRDMLDRFVAPWLSKGRAS